MKHKYRNVDKMPHTDRMEHVQAVSRKRNGILDFRIEIYNKLSAVERPHYNQSAMHYCRSRIFLLLLGCQYQSLINYGVLLPYFICCHTRNDIFTAWQHQTSSNN